MGRRGRCSVAHAAKKRVNPSNNGAAPELIERIEDRDLQKEASESYLAVRIKRKLCRSRIVLVSGILIQ